MTSMFKIGDQVTVVDNPKFPGVWTVTKVNPRTVKVTQNGRNLTADPYLLAAFTGTAAEATAVTIPMPLAVGEVCRLAGKDGLYVVIKDSPDKVNVARLGGDGGRYWRAMRRNVIPVSLDELELGVEV